MVFRIKPHKLTWKGENGGYLLPTMTYASVAPKRYIRTISSSLVFEQANSLSLAHGFFNQRPSEHFTYINTYAAHKSNITYVHSKKPSQF